MRSLRTGLGPRIVALMILASAGLSILAAGVQVWVGYKRDYNGLLTEFAVIENGFLSSLETALWHFNIAQVDVLLDGIYAQSDVVSLELHATSGQSWTRGTRPDAPVMTREFILEFDRPPPVGVGSLHVALSFEGIQARIWHQIATLLLSNFAKTFAATIAMFIIFDTMVARHLRQLASSAREADWESGELQFDLGLPDDELTQIAAALNAAGARIKVMKQHETSRHQELRRANEHLRQANREQAEFTYAVSHDLKSPSHTLGMLLDELSTVQQDNPEVSEITSDMARIVERMRNLVDDVQDYSQLVDAGPDASEMSVQDILADVQTELRPEIEAADAVIEVQDLPKVNGSSAQLRVLFRNLLSNALKFRAIDRRPAITISADGDTRSILVADNGIGIPQVHHERVFGLFNRLHTRDEYEGTGLGLTICRRIMANHGGDIQIVPGNGLGTVFRLAFWKENEGDQTCDAGG